MSSKGNPGKNQSNPQRQMKETTNKWTLNPHLKLERKDHNVPPTGELGLQPKAAIPLIEAEAGGGHPWMTWTMSLPLNVKGMTMTMMMMTSSFPRQTPVPLHQLLVGIPVEPPAQIRDGSEVGKIPCQQARQAKPVLARGKEGGTRRVQT